MICYGQPLQSAGFAGNILFRGSIILGLYSGYIGDILGLCRDNGKENGNYYKTGRFASFIVSFLPAVGTT